MDSISINGSSDGSGEFPIATVFDVSSTWGYVPTSVFQVLKAKIGVTTVSDDYGMVNFSCNAVPNDTTIAFKFGDLNPEFDLDLFIGQGSFFLVKPWVDLYTKGIDKDTCFFQILENKFDDWEAGGAIFCSNIISLIYSVFDLDNEQISLAKRNKNIDAADDIVEISSGKDGVPGAKKDSDSAGTSVGEKMSMTALVAATAMLVVAF